MCKVESGKLREIKNHFQVLLKAWERTITPENKLGDPQKRASLKKYVSAQRPKGITRKMFELSDEIWETIKNPGFNKINTPETPHQSSGKKQKSSFVRPHIASSVGTKK